jgi:hypothetical protein
LEVLGLFGVDIVPELADAAIVSSLLTRERHGGCVLSFGVFILSFFGNFGIGSGVSSRGSFDGLEVTCSFECLFALVARGGGFILC